MMAAAAATEAQTAQPSSDASSAAFPRWVMLQQNLKIEVESSSCSTSGATGSKTLVAARTSTGHLIQVSLRLTEPPGVSCVCLQIPDGLDASYSSVVAAHGDSVLIDVVLIDVSTEENDPPGRTLTEDHFVYSAGAAAADPPRPPSLSLLPPFFFLGHRPTGLVRRGDDDVVVVGQVASVPPGPDTPELMREADLSLFRSGEWSVRRLQIKFRNAAEVPGNLPSLWKAVVPVGDDGGLLCWVSVDPWYLGVLLCDVFDDETPGQYLPLPMENIWGTPSNRNVCATAGGDALKFVNIFPRCCCGCPATSSCQRSCHAYTIQTWTMRITGNGDDDMEWAKDAIVDASELWAPDSYKGLRCFSLDHPVVSLDEPDVICLWLHQQPQEDGYRRGTVDVLMVNTRTKTIHSVSQYEDVLLSDMRDGLIPSNVSYFFNSYPPISSVAEPSVQAPEIVEAFSGDT